MKVKHALLIGYLFFMGLSALEFLTYQGVVANYFAVGLPYWGVGVLVTVFLACWLRKNLLQDWFIIPINNKIVVPVSAVLLLLLFGLEGWNYDNFVFSRLNVNYYALIDLTLFGVIFTMITASKKYIQKYWQILVFSLFLLFSLFLYHYYPATFSNMSRSSGSATDDNFMEWLQVLILGVGVVISGVLAVNTKKNPLLKIAFFFAGLIFLFLIGEEISWRERLFTFSGLEFLRENNYQNELNVHNRQGINEISIFFYILTFLYGFATWLLRWWAERKGVIQKKGKMWWSVLCFKGQEVLFLLPTFIFNPYADRAIGMGFPSILDLYVSWGVIPDLIKTLGFVAIWREAFEVLFYTALVLHLVNIYLESKEK